MSRSLVICWLISPVTMVKLSMFPKATPSCALVTPAPLSPTVTSPTYQLIPTYIPMYYRSPTTNHRHNHPPWPCISFS